jgi:fumarate reductase flavoprotein subunit
VENLEADIVVIGGGGCGFSAAAAAAEKGAEVILLEKKGAPGGNSAFAIGPFAVESPAQRRMGIGITKDEAFKLSMEYARWSINPRICRAYVDKSGDTIKWLEAKGLKFDNIPQLYPGHSHVDREAGPTILKVLRKNCEDLGVRLLFHCAAKKILTGEKGKISGVLATMKGKELKINAKAVIMATGGYGGNKELLKKYRPSYNENMCYIGFPHVTGDGLLMALDIGAATEGLGTLMLHTHFYKGPTHVNAIAQEPLTTWVNKNGERFADEAVTLRPTECGNIIDRQPDKCVYSLFDEKIKNLLLEEGFIKSGYDKPGVAGTKPTNLDSELRAEADKGGVKISDSWDEIAAWIGVDPKVLNSTIEEYNTFCDHGHDELFAKDQKYLQPLRNPPYYAIRCYLCFLTTIGGIKINHHMEVLDHEDKPIPGFYAGGDTTGGWESETYCIILSGSAFGFAINSGRIAGENAASNVLGR